MKETLERGIEEFSHLPKPVRYSALSGLWLLSVIVVGAMYGLFAAVLASTVAISFAYLIKPYREQHADKGVVAVLLSLIDLRRPSLSDIALAAAGVVAIIASELLFALILGTLAPEGAAGHGVASAARSSPGLLVLASLFLSAAVIAPIMEEFVFRNGLQKLVAFRIGDIGAIIVTSLLFASLHIPAYGGFDVPITALALPLSVVFTGSVVFGTLYWRTRNVAVSMLSHGAFNAFALTVAVVA